MNDMNSYGGWNVNKFTTVLWLKLSKNVLVFAVISIYYK